MKNVVRKLLIYFLSAAVLFPLESSIHPGFAFEIKEDEKLPETLAPPFLAASKSKWVDSLMKILTPEERIGQLLMVAAWSDKNSKHVTEITKLIKTNKIGGLIFMQGGPVRQARLTNKFQAISKVPLLIAMDAEFGLSMRLDSTVQFPRQMTMGAIHDDSLIYQMGAELARQCKRLGVHVSFSPVADVNNNPANPVIGTRSFGENKFSVAEKAVRYMKGLQDNHVLACGKHFPGHGDTDSDSHTTLPVISHDSLRLDSVELYPFKQLIKEGLGSMMVAHLYIPAYDTTRNQATTLSKNVVTRLLQEQLEFQGLIFTDALNMKGVSKYNAPGEVDVKALLAGNDVLLFSGDVPKAVAMIKEAIAKGEISQEEVDARCRKILAAKQWCGLDKMKPVNPAGIVEDLNSPHAEFLRRQILEQAITLLKNDNNLIPLLRLDTLKIAALAVGKNDSNAFQERAASYAPIAKFSLRRNGKRADRDTALKKLLPYNCVLLSLHDLSQKPARNFGIEELDLLLIDTLKKLGKCVILDVFGPPYALNSLRGAENCDAVILSYENQLYIEDLSAQIIFGGIPSQGKLPVTTVNWIAGSGVNTGPQIRLKYTVPEEVGFSRKAMERIDSIVAEGIKEHAFPGCQVFAAKDGKVFFEKSYGHFTYEKKHTVRKDDLYDIASITKIVATVPAVMKMVEEKKMNMDEELSTYLPELKGTNKEEIVIREMLAHQAGLKAWIPFYLRTLDPDGGRDKKFYRSTFSDSFPIYVAPGVFLTKGYRDTIYKSITNSAVSPVHTYLYSDLGYYYLKRIIEQEKNMLLSIYADSVFYHPLGLPLLGFQPRLRIPTARIAPTENDKRWRGQLIQGDVHDQGAAMLGGIGGHAGVFSNANDVGVMMQLFLNYGEYGGRRYFDSMTVATFTSYQYLQNGNRRGIGFDKPETDPEKPNPACDSISCNSFGHQGFTGTQAWADPETGLVYVFLSNRIYPDAEQNKLVQLGIRTAIMQELVEGLK